jgi:hypothetical protein
MRPTLASARRCTRACAARGNLEKFIQNHHQYQSSETL